MSLPLLMNKMRIVIQQLSKSRTVEDPDFREAVGGDRQHDTQIELMGQVNIASKPSFYDMMRSRTGDTEPTRGRLVFKKSDLVAADVTLQKGDLIVEVGPVAAPTPINCLIEQVRPESPWRGDFLLIVAEFNQDPRKKGSVNR